MKGFCQKFTIDHCENAPIYIYMCNVSGLLILLKPNFKSFCKVNEKKVFFFFAFPSPLFSWFVIHYILYLILVWSVAGILGHAVEWAGDHPRDLLREQRGPPPHQQNSDLPRQHQTGTDRTDQVLKVNSSSIRSRLIYIRGKSARRRRWSICNNVNRRITPGFFSMHVYIRTATEYWYIDILLLGFFPAMASLLKSFFRHWDFLIIEISVSDPLHFDADPDPRIHFRDNGSGSGSGTGSEYDLKSN